MNSDFRANYTASIINKLEEIIHFDVGNRGISGLWTKGELVKAVNDLNTSDEILILTGFHLPKAGAAETDGPPGAVSIANSLISLGKNVIMMTDSFSYDVVSGIVKENKNSIPLICYQDDMSLINILDSLRIENAGKIAIISVERPGRSEDGRYYSMRGYDVSDYNKPLDSLFIEAEKNREQQIVTMAIGDGGNEIGMGNIYDSISKNIPFGAKIASKVKADHLITAGVSNWGGFAISYALKLLNPDVNVDVMTSDLHEKTVSIMIKYGAVDGVTLRNECSVDGFKMDVHNEILKRMKEAICEYS
jgi:hypothetical protein